MKLNNKQSDAISDHHHCRLGKWYYEGEGQECFSKLSGYKNIEQPHQEVHNNGKLILDYFHKGDYVSAIESLEYMESASIKVLDLLEKMACDAEDHRELLCVREH